MITGTLIDIATDLRLMTRPAIEPLDLEEVKKARRFSPTSLDTLFDLWIGAARQEYEEMTGRQLITATWAYILDAFPDDGVIELPRPPLQSVTSVSYDDGAGPVVFASSNYRVVTPSGVHPTRGRIALLNSATWPTLTYVGQPGAVTIQFQAGYGNTPGDVPSLVKYALLMLVGHFHKYGEEIQEAKSQLSMAQLPVGAGSVMRAARHAASQTVRPVRTAWV